MKLEVDIAPPFLGWVFQTQITGALWPPGTRLESVLVSMVF